MPLPYFIAQPTPVMQTPFCTKSHSHTVTVQYAGVWWVTDNKTLLDRHHYHSTQLTAQTNNRFAVKR